MSSERQRFQSAICQWSEFLHARYASFGWKFSRWRKEYPARTIEMVWQRWHRARHTELPSISPIVASNVQTVLVLQKSLREKFWQAVVNPFSGALETGFRASMAGPLGRRQNTKLLTRLVSRPANMISVISKLALVNRAQIANFRSVYLETNSMATPLSPSATRDGPRPAIGFTHASYPMAHAPSGTRPVLLPITNPRAISTSPSSAVPSSQGGLSSRQASFSEATTVRASSVSVESGPAREIIIQPAPNSPTAQISTTTRPGFLPVVYSQALSVAGLSRIRQSSTLPSKLAFPGTRRKTVPFPVRPDTTATGYVPVSLGSVASGTGLPAPLAVRQSPRWHNENLLYIKPLGKQLDIEQLQESLARRVEESLEMKVAAKVETTVARELSPESAYGRRLRERLINDLHGDLVLEKERLGLG
jgi:hypothetical protein